MPTIEDFPNELFVGTWLGRPVSDANLEEPREFAWELDKRFRVRRLKQGDGTWADVVFSPTDGRVYRTEVVFPQEFEGEGVQRQLERGRRVSTSMRSALGDGTLRQSNNQKNATRTWELEGANVAFEFVQRSNVAGWYAELRVWAEVATDRSEFLGPTP